MRAPEDELIFYKRDLALLTVFGFVVREGGRLVLTGLGERELESPASKAAFAEVLVDCFEVGRVTPDPMALEAPRGTEHK